MRQRGLSSGNRVAPSTPRRAIISVMREVRKGGARWGFRPDPDQH